MSGIKIPKQYEKQETIALGWHIHDATTGEVFSSGLTEKGKELMGKFKEMEIKKEDRVIELENALYAVINANDLAYAKEIAADVLEEDLDAYLEEEGLEELDFDDDKYILDEGFEDE